MVYRVGMIVGSLRRGAYSRLLAEVIKRLDTGSLSFFDIGIGELPLYNADLDVGNPPQAWSAFRSEVAAADGVLVITPEHNRGMPGAVKNALDVGSRPYGRGVWIGKPAVIISQSTGALGGTAANQQLRLTLALMSAEVPPGNEVSIPHVAGLFDEHGRLKNEEVQALLTSFLRTFERWIMRLK